MICIFRRNLLLKVVVHPDRPTLRVDRPGRPPTVTVFWPPHSIRSPRPSQCRTLNPSPAMTNPRRGGKVSEVAFRRAWPFKKEFKPQEIDLLCERFKTKGGDIHYMALHNEIAEVLPDPAQPFPTSPLYLRPDDTRWSHEDLHVVDKLRSKVAEKRIRMKEFFQDFDPLRKGFCTPGQTKTVFTVLNLSKELGPSVAQLRSGSREWGARAARFPKFVFTLPHVLGRPDVP